MLQTKIWGTEQFKPTLQGSFYTFMPIDSQQVAMSATTVSSAESVVESDADASGWTLPEHDLSRIIVDCFKQVPQVHSICAKLGDGDEMTVWTLLESYDRDAREAVYGKEMIVCQSLHVYNFDFRVTSHDLVSSKELVDGGFREVYRRT